MFSVITIHFGPLNYCIQRVCFIFIKIYCVIVSQNQSANLKNELNDNIKVIITTSELK